jgi:segregation and condensation protein A
MERTDPAAEQMQPQTGEFRVQLPAFEGPLDLLLHLIKKHELDILDLPVAFVTERYLEYLRIMQDLDLDMASEYLLMAATLAHIKSKLLLPRAPEDQQDGDEEDQQDPRLELIRRLLEYQKYKQAAEHLGARSVAGRDVFARGSSVEDLQGPAPLAEIGLFKLLDAFQSILDRAQDRLALEVTAERITIQERITQITDFLRDRRACTFDDLFQGAVTRYEIVVTFLALLEMTKLRVTRIYQPDHRSSIHVQYALLDADAPTIPPPDERGYAEPEASAALPEEPEPEPEQP